MGEAWSKERFEDHWYSAMPAGTVGVTIPCDCEEDFCHGWQMRSAHIPIPVKTAAPKQEA